MSVEKELYHIDQWLDDHIGDNGLQNFKDEEMNKVWRFFNFKRSSALYQHTHSMWLKVFAKYEGVEYRVTGASRMGDVYLTSDFDQSVGYEKRGVSISDLTDFRVVEEIPECECRVSEIAQIRLHNTNCPRHRWERKDETD